MTVSVAPGAQTVTLLDNGAGQDEVAGDGVYSGAWTTTAAGTFTLSFDGLPDDTVTIEVDPDVEAGIPGPDVVAR